MAAPTSTLRVNWARKRPFEAAARTISGLVGWWRMGESAGTLAHDEIGGNPGTYTGGYTLGTAGLLAGDGDSAVTLNGSTGYVTIADDALLDTTDTFSFVALIDRTATGAKHYIAQKGTGAWGLYVSAADALTLEEVGTADIVASTTTLDAAAHFVAVTKSGSTVKLYIDGLDVTGTVTNQTLANTASALEIGRSAVPGNYFSGILDECLLFNVALTAAQVVSLHVAYAQGEFGANIDAVQSYVDMGEHTMDLARGSNADYSGDVIGELTFTADNRSAFWTPDRNLVPNPSLESGLHDIDTAAITSVIAAPTGISWSTNAASGSYSVRVVCPATDNAGISQSIDGYFPASAPISASVQIDSISGSTSVEVGLASSGTPAEIAVSASTITTAFATYSVTLTPSVAISDLVVFVRVHTASAATFDVDCWQVNRGSSANTFAEAPTGPMLAPGAPIHWYGTYSGTNYPLFGGTIERIDPRPESFFADVVCHDGMGTLDVPIEISAAATTGYKYRQHVIAEAWRQYSHGAATENLCLNGSFETDTAGWSAGTRSTAVTPPFGSASLLIPGDVTSSYNLSTNTLPYHTYLSGRYYTFSFYARLRGSADELEVIVGTVAATDATITTGTGRYPSLTSSWQRYSVTWLCTATTTAVRLTLDPTSAIAARGAYVDGVMISEGLALPDYVDYGATVTRRRNLLEEGNDYAAVEVVTPWGHGWYNRCTNPEAVTDTSGWSVAGDAFTTSGGVITRVTAGGYGDGNYATAFEFNPGAANDGTFFAVTGTFRSGRTYTLYVDFDYNGTDYTVGIGSQGTPADKAQVVPVTDTGVKTVTWVPTGNRSDAHIYLNSITGATCVFSGVFVAPGTHPYTRAGITSPNNLDEANTITSVAGGTFGGSCTQVVTYATAGSGAILVSSAYRLSFAAYTVDVWLRTTSGTPPVVIGIGDPWQADSNSRTVTLSTTWQRFTVRWTPSGNTITAGRNVLAFVMAGAASATTIQIDGASMVAGKALQPYLPAVAGGVDTGEVDILPAGSLYHDEAIEGLGRYNAEVLARHWFTPLMVTPWQEYTSSARVTLAAKAVTETIVSTTGDGIQAVEGFELDRQSLYNLIRVVTATTSVTPGTGATIADYVVVTAYDADSARRYGLRSRVVGNGLINSPIGTDDTAYDIADLVLARYRVPRSRPQIVLTNHFPQTLQRMPDDVLAITYTRHGINGVRYTLLSYRLSVGESGQRWDFRAVLEEWVAA